MRRGTKIERSTGTQCKTSSNFSAKRSISSTSIPTPILPRLDNGKHCVLQPHRKPPSNVSHQPPKRRVAAAAAASSSTPKPRQSKLAKEHNITSAQESEIQEAFQLFLAPSSTPKEPLISTSSLRRALAALSLPTSGPELAELTDAADPEGEGYIPYENFVAIAALKLHAKDDEEGDEERREEVEKAFRLFTGGQGDVITMAMLKRVARELKEDLDDSVLRDMLREANGGGRGVSIEDFEGVMRRAGVFR